MHRSTVLAEALHLPGRTCYPRILVPHAAYSLATYPASATPTSSARLAGSISGIVKYLAEFLVKESFLMRTLSL